MKYHFLATIDAAPADVDVLSSRHGGRRFITEEGILSWFKDLDSMDHEARDGFCRSERDGACL